jgi:hypothetical protein
MRINAKTKSKLTKLFENVNYRAIVAKRANCHPNTVSNVLLHGHDNLKVAKHLIKLGREVKALSETKEVQELLEIAEQL